MGETYFPESKSRTQILWGKWIGPIVAKHSSYERRMVMKTINTKSADESVEGSQMLILKNYVSHSSKRKCNLCEIEFHPHSKFDRFCDLCKVERELYHFAEWLEA